MKSVLIIAATLNFVRANPSDHFYTWSPPGPGDVRAPCPMLNTLANHGFLPHHGKNIDRNTTIAALGNALNGDAILAEMLFESALPANLATPNATTFSLDDLDNHNIVEHDASLSRGDFYFGDDHTFNRTIYEESRAYWTNEIIDVQMAANARAARVVTCNATNPTFNMTYMANQGFAEQAAYFLALGDMTTHTVSRSFVEYLFEHERLPLELGWRPSATPLTIAQLVETIGLIVKASPSTPQDVVSTKSWVGGAHTYWALKGAQQAALN